MHTATWVVAAGSVIICTNALAAAPKLPATVAADLKSIAGECSSVGGTPKTDDAVKIVDLNGDGKEDYVLDVGSIQCDGAASIYGDRTKMVSVYVGDGAGGAKQAFSEWVYGASIEGSGASAKLWLTVSGQQCGKPPARDFASEAFCNRSIAWNGKAQKFEFAPVSTVRMIQ
jgi:hypothetical protein